MGVYINPADGRTKEQWLEEEKFDGETTLPPGYEEFKAGQSQGLELVCLVNNGPFTAAGIAYNDREYDEFCREDYRPKLWFWVERAKLVDPQVSPLSSYVTL